VRTCLKDVPANCSAVQEVAAPATTASITNAKTGANIVASVKAVNDGGSSAEIKSATLFNPDFTLPVMRLDTTGGAPIVSEDDYLTASWSLDPNGTGVTGYTGQTTEIKGRGNSTWQMPKKPYRLKLTSGRPLLGMTSAKHWALLANYADPTNMRNALALHLGQMAGFAWTPHEGFVELVLNGKYVGLYELAEVVRVDANRVNVDTTNGGYLIELDERLDGPETNTFTTDHDTNVVIKEPEAATSTQKTFMSNYMKNFEHALFGAKFEDPTNGYAKYIDVDSFVDYFIIQEYVMNTDVMWSSTFFHMNGGGKLVAGPLWDFDLAFGRTLDNYFPENDWDWMRSRWAWWARLFEDDAFKAKVAARWAQLKPLLATAPGYVDTLNTKLATAAGYNRTIWPPVVTPEDPDKTYPLSVSNLKTFVTGRHGWFDGAFGN
jgi:hypothetical protein